MSAGVIAELSVDGGDDLLPALSAGVEGQGQQDAGAFRIVVRDPGQGHT